MSVPRVVPLLLALAIAGPAHAQDDWPLGAPWETSQRTWSLQEGLPQASVTCLTQTRDGYLWCGTFGGLARFDGVRFTVHEVATTPGLGSNRILSVVEAVDGALWIGTEDGGISRHVDGTFETFGPGRGVAQGQVWSLHVDQHGALWAGTAGGLKRFDGVRFVDPGLPDPDALLQAHVFDMADARDGGLWLAGGSGLIRFDPREGLLERVYEPPPTDAWLSVAETRDGQVWFGAEQLLRRRPDGTVETIARLPDSVWDLLEDRSGTLWAATEGGPYRILDDRLVATAPQHADRRMRCLFEDRERNLWCGLAVEGLLQLRRGELVGFGTAQRLPGGASVVAPAIDGGLWIGHEGGLLRMRDGRLRALPIAGAVNTLLPEADGLWIGTGDEGLLRLRDDELQPVAIDGAREGALRALLRDARGRLWVGGSQGLHVQTEAGWSSLRRAEGLVDDDVRCLLEDQQGTLWIGTAGGVSCWRDGSIVKSFTSGAGFPRGMVRAFHQDARGAVWIGTYGGGLARWLDDELVTLTTQQGLTENIVSVILPDGDGHLVINGNRGVSRYALAELHAVADGRQPRADGVLFSAAPGMTTGEGNGGSQPAGCVLPDGTLWLPTIEGLVRLDANIGSEPALPVAVRIEELSVDGVALPRDDSAEARPGRRDVTIRYTALGLAEPERLMFRYRMAGRGGAWVDAGMRREAVYTGLPPGEHVFEVVARNEDGVWSRAPRRLSFTLQPYLWETTRFAIGVALLVLVALLLYVRRRVMRVRRHARELEQLVQERTRELEAEVVVRGDAEERLREARDELEARVRRRTSELADALQSLQDDVARREALERQLLQSQKLEGVGRLAGGVAHDFNNLLTVIRGCAHGLQDQLERDGTRSYAELTQIQEAADRAAQLTRQLLSFARQDVVQRQVLDLNALVTGIDGMLQRLLGEELRLITQPSDEPQAVDADPNQLEQVLVNLCVNARDAMPRGGCIRVSVGRVELDVAAATELGLGPGSYATLEVRDDGQGMPDDVRQHAFEPFFTTKDASQGTGLGLSTCYGIVRELGGQIDLASQPDDGTTVTVYVPRSGDALTPHADVEDDADLHGDGNVLLVEDQQPVRRAVRSMLEALGFDVLEATGGAQALELARLHGDAIDVVLCDVVMPGMRGPELIVELRGEGLQAPVVLMTGHADQQLPGDLAAAVIVKPPTRRELLEALQAARV